MRDHLLVHYGWELTVLDQGPVSFLRLFLDRGEAEGRPQSAEIEMLCDLNLESYLEFINEYNGIHSFRWTTRHGCPTNILGRMDMQSSKSSTITEEASEETEQNDEDELRPPVGVSAARPWIAVILVIVVSAAYFFYFAKNSERTDFSF